jgi:hypothetical protein
MDQSSRRARLALATDRAEPPTLAVDGDLRGVAAGMTQPHVEEDSRRLGAATRCDSAVNGGIGSGGIGARWRRELEAAGLRDKRLVDFSAWWLG